MKNIRIYITIIILVISVFYSCSTKKNTFLTRTYHNLTAHYNPYFNGNDKFKTAVKAFEKNYKDDYTQIIPVYKYPDKTQGQSLSSSMDVVIEKGTKVIKFHSITVPPKHKKLSRGRKRKNVTKRKEYNNWVDDAYLLIGKAKFYKYDLMGALQTFDYVQTEYNYDKIKYDASLWKAKTLSAQKKYQDAENILLLLDGEKDFPKKLKANLYGTLANNYIKQGMYKQAILYLRKSLDYEKKRQQKIRDKFILAQLYEHLGNYQSASNLYAYIAKSNAPYEMQFAAAIHQATSYVSRKGNFKSTIKQLNKMLRDEKNKEYKDQIYYAIANVYIKERDTTNAIKALKNSSIYNKNNNYQKAQTLLLIASIYYDKHDYKNAKVYYDSTMMFLNPNYKDYEEIMVRKDNLSDLISNIETIQREDSLQRLANMTEKERNKVINKIIKEVRKQKQEKHKEEVEQQQYHMYQQMQNTSQPRMGSSSGKWYFYNPAMVSLGKSEFKRIWGNRPLEDNWRRKNKSPAGFDENDNQGFNPSDSLVNGIPLDETSEYYLKNVPLTDSAMQVSLKKMEDALFETGVIYRKRFNEIDLSIHYFELLLKKFPNTSYKLNTYYNLYQLYSLKKNNEKSNYYKSLIAKDFPNSEINKMISDPNYLSNQQAVKDSIKTLYMQTYNYFTHNLLNRTLNNIEKFKQKKTSYLAPKFMLIEAFTYAKKGDLSKMKFTLEKVTAQYKGTTEDSLAQYYLSFIENNDSLLQTLRAQSLLAQNTSQQETNSTTSQSDTLAQNQSQNNKLQEEEIPSPYKYLPSEAHSYLVIVDDDPEIVNRIKFNIINFNVDHFPMFDFNVKTVLFGTDKKLISVNGLKDADQALKYFKSLLYYKVFEGIDTSMYKHFIISTTNYAPFFKDKDIKGYQKFFIKNYILKPEEQNKQKPKKE